MKWILWAVIFLLVGLVLQLELLVYAMYALLGMIVVSRYFAHQWTENIAARRECNRETAQIDDKVAVIVTVENQGHHRVAWLLMEDGLPKDAFLQKPPRLKIERSRRMITSLKSRCETALKYQVHFKMRGYYQIGPLLVESGDLFGLHRKYKILSKPQFVLVYPKVLPLESYNIASRKPIGEIRMSHRLYEDPTRISGVRPYQMGDPLNRIHWRATARTGELHSKTFEPSSIAGASILMDFHKASFPSRGLVQRSELAVTAAASLSNALYQLNQQVGFFTNARDAADRVREEGWKHEFASRNIAREQMEKQEENTRLRPVEVPTRRGADQLQRILESLARAELTDGLRFPEFVLQIAGHLPRDATVIAILPFVSLETATALAALKRKGFAISVVLVMYNDEEDFPECLGRLIAERIEVRRIEDEEMLSQICSEQLVAR